jgi:hypothetical protein
MQVCLDFLVPVSEEGIVLRLLWNYLYHILRIVA